MQSLEQRTLYSAGLTATYYDDTALTRQLSTRTDSAINFTWNSKLAGSSDSSFGAVWNGNVTAKYSEYYTFYVKSTGGVKLWVNGQQLINDPTNTSSTLDTAREHTQFVAGQSYSIKLQYTSTDTPASLQLMWSSTRTAHALIPGTSLTTAAAANGYKISFRPSTSAAASGYLSDNGLAYGARSGGAYYGWSAKNSSAFDRNSSLSYSERYDAGAAFNAGNTKLTWKIKVANGLYSMRLVGGDASTTVGNEQIDVNGKLALTGALDAYDHWYDGTSTVKVTNGFITLSSDAKATSALNKINFVEITPTTDASKVIGWYTVGYTGANASANYTFPQDFTDGWQTYIDDNQINSAIANGMTRVVLHNPFGLTQDQNMVLDQYQNAQAAGLNFLTDSFVSTWKPITAKGVEVIAYIGSFSETHTLNNDAAGMAYFMQSVQPYIDAGMSIGLDASSGALPSSLINAAAQKLRSMNVKVYVEARPQKASPNLFNYPVISETNFWTFSDLPAWTQPSGWAATDASLTGEIIRWIQLPPTGLTWETPGWLTPETQSLVNSGFTVALSMDCLSNTDHTSIATLSAAANAVQSKTAVVSAMSLQRPTIDYSRSEPVATSIGQNQPADETVFSQLLL